MRIYEKNVQYNDRTDKKLSITERAKNVNFRGLTVPESVL